MSKQRVKIVLDEYPDKPHRDDSIKVEVTQNAEQFIDRYLGERDLFITVNIDYRQEAVIYGDIDDLRKFSGWYINRKLIAMLEAYANEYRAYAEGEVYGIVLEQKCNSCQQWEQTDSVWGFYGYDDAVCGASGHFPGVAIFMEGDDHWD